MAKILKRHLKQTLAELQEIPVKELVRQRIAKYRRMGAWEELPQKGAESAGKGKKK